jgi:hypothetical protein
VGLVKIHTCFQELKDVLQTIAVQPVGLVQIHTCFQGLTPLAMDDRRVAAANSDHLHNPVSQRERGLKSEVILESFPRAFQQ